MHILQKEKDAATGTAEEAVFVAVVDIEEIDSRRDIDLPLSPANAAQRMSMFCNTAVAHQDTHLCAHVHNLQSRKLNKK